MPLWRRRTQFLSLWCAICVACGCRSPLKKADALYERQQYYEAFQEYSHLLYNCALTFEAREQVEHWQEKKPIVDWPAVLLRDYVIAKWETPSRSGCDKVATKLAAVQAKIRIPTISFEITKKYDIPSVYQFEWVYGAFYFPNQDILPPDAHNKAQEAFSTRQSIVEVFLAQTVSHVNAIFYNSDSHHTLSIPPQFPAGLATSDMLQLGKNWFILRLTNESASPRFFALPIDVGSGSSFIVYRLSIAE